MTQFCVNERNLIGITLAQFSNLMTCQSKFFRNLITTVLTIGFLQPLVGNSVQAQEMTCRLSANEVNQKQSLLQAAANGDQSALTRYQSLVSQHARQLNQCRNQSWPRTQGIWLRLYACDSKPGAIDTLLDQIVARGYNQLYVDVFSNGQVLLPSGNNPTVWPSAIQGPGTERVDLLAQVIQKGRERGLKVYAWLFSLNFGYIYGIRPERESVLARNGQGETTLTVATKNSQSDNPTAMDEIFVDPYNPQARSEYLQLVQAVLQRRPDGVLFDYIRYPKGVGGASVASKVKDLWIYGDASSQVLSQRGLNQKGQELIRRYVTQGYVTAEDLVAVDKLYPQEQEPLWQTRSPSVPWTAPVAQRLPAIQAELWSLAVGHAMQGVIEFLTNASAPVQQQGIPVGVAFFPEANQTVGKGFDSRLQPWDRFPAAIEWHPMSYGVCGNTSCIEAQVQKVLSQATPGTVVSPVLTGRWQEATEIRPALESQMAALRSQFPQLQSVSHFSFGWQEPQIERSRQFCRL